MKILPPEPDVDLYNEGFGEDDLLQRKKVGKALSSLVDRIEDPLVIALAGDWGTGKTHFLKRWVGAHTLENGSQATTVYFDAFANDYLNDPLPALVSSLTDRLPSGNEAKVQKIKTAAFKLAKPLARIGLKVATFGITEAVGDLGDAVTEAISNESAASLEKYWEEEAGRREAMLEFKAAIEALTTPSTDKEQGSTLVFVIDELDRCRPDYALEVLEVIKHFFSVPHVHFILGVNLRALENSVQARYGSKTNGHAYLKKFIQLTLELPVELGIAHSTKGTNLVYLDHLIKEMGVPPHIIEPLKSQVALMSKVNHVSMRDIGKIVSSISLANEEVLTLNNYYTGWIVVMVSLVIAKILRPDLYPKLLDSTITNAELASYIGATAATIERTTNGKRNPEYNHQVFWLYHTWLYITQNGNIDNIDPGLKSSLIGQFDQFGSIDRPHELPMKIHTKWLDHFSFYTP